MNKQIQTINSRIGLSSNNEINVYKINENAVIPQYAHKGDVGMDLTAISVEYNLEKDVYIYHTGLTITSTVDNYSCFLFPRSSNNKKNCYLANSVGIVDIRTYRGEIMICFKDRTSLSERITLAQQEAKIDFILQKLTDKEKDFIIDSDYLNRYMEEVKNQVINDVINLKYAPYEVGERVAQMVVMPHPYIELNEIFTLDETLRGSGGFGSTNK